MKGELVVGTSIDAFKEVIDAHTDKNADSDRIERIIAKYSPRYAIKGEVAVVKRKKIHVDYLPALDAMLEATKTYDHPKEVVGAALYKIELDHCLFFTEPNDPNLKRNYKKHQAQADELAGTLWSLVDKEFNLQWTHITASVLSGSFWTAFGESYWTWRQSLDEHFRIIGK